MFVVVGFFLSQCRTSFNYFTLDLINWRCTVGKKMIQALLNFFFSVSFLTVGRGPKLELYFGHREKKFRTRKTCEIATSTWTTSPSTWKARSKFHSFQVWHLPESFLFLNSFLFCRQSRILFSLFKLYFFVTSLWTMLDI